MRPAAPFSLCLVSRSETQVGSLQSWCHPRLAWVAGAWFVKQHRDITGTSLEMFAPDPLSPPRVEQQVEAPEWPCTHQPWLCTRLWQGGGTICI